MSDIPADQSEASNNQASCADERDSKCLFARQVSLMMLILLMGGRRRVTSNGANGSEANCKRLCLFARRGIGSAFAFCWRARRVKHGVIPSTVFRQNREYNSDLTDAYSHHPISYTSLRPLSTPSNPHPLTPRTLFPSKPSPTLPPLASSHYHRTSSPTLPLSILLLHPLLIKLIRRLLHLRPRLPRRRTPTPSTRVCVWDRGRSLLDRGVAGRGGFCG